MTVVTVVVTKASLVTKLTVETLLAVVTLGTVVKIKTKSRSEQAPGSVFHPRDESGKIACDFL